MDKAKGELNQYFSDSLQYSYDATDNIKPTGDEIPKVFGWVQTANRERGSYTVDNIIVAKDKAEFNVSMSTISMKAADDAYGANHPNLTDDLKNYLQSNGANAGNVINSVATAFTVSSCRSTNKTILHGNLPTEFNQRSKPISTKDRRN